jgi:NitT/TauT family transport system substrate-binding protein
MISLPYGIPTDKEGIQLRLGVARGFFRDEGIDLDIRVVFGGPEISAKYDSGELRLGEIGSPPAITAMSKGARFKVIASGVRRHAVQYLVGSPRVGGWPDLKGKTAAALSIGSCSYWFMRLVLHERGLDPDRDLNVIGLGPRYPRVLELFQSGELDAAVLSEPNVTLGESKGLFRVMQALTDAEFCPGMQWSLVVANQRAIAEQPELLRAVLRASRRSYAYCEHNPDEWARFAAAHYGSDFATMQRANARELPDLGWDCRLDLGGLQQAIDLQLRLGAIKAPMRTAEIVDLSFLPEKEPV